MTMRASSRPVRRRFESRGGNEDRIESSTLLRSLGYARPARACGRALEGCGIRTSDPTFAHLVHVCLVSRSRNHENISKWPRKHPDFFVTVLLSAVGKIFRPILQPRNPSIAQTGFPVATSPVRDHANLTGGQPTDTPHVPDKKSDGTSLPPGDGARWALVRERSGALAIRRTIDTSR